MLTLEKIVRDYSLVNPMTGNDQCYHNIEVFDGLGEFCDVFFGSKNEQVKEEQITTYNVFKAGLKKYLKEIELYIEGSLTASEQKRSARINEAALRFYVIDVPYENQKYDLILICGKNYRGFLRMRKEISVRVEIKGGSIRSIQRKRDILKDND